MANPVGRPVEYTPELAAKVTEYIETTGREQTKLPTLAGFAVFLGIDTDTVQAWKKLYPEFSVSCKKILSIQQEQLIDDGMYGGKEVNPAMAIFLLKNNHGMKDRTDVTTNDHDIPTPIYGSKSSE